jgi:NAD(P)-dependent dehydrogenase (short-subunit alcohol dehydrogenase family)
VIKSWHPADLLDRSGRIALVTRAAGASAPPTSTCEKRLRLIEDEQVGLVDILVNNAGSSPICPDLASICRACYDKVHGLNARGPFRLATVIGSRMHEGDGASIINVSTIGSLQALAGAGPRHGQGRHEPAEQSLDDTYGPKVRASTVPGSFATDVAKQTRSFEGDEHLAASGQPHEMVGICVYLASNAAPYTDGALIEVARDG